MNEWLSAPDAAVWALFLGMMLIYVECNRPGWVVPGCAGGLAVLLAVHRLGRLPLSVAGLEMCACGVLLIVGSAVLRGWRISVVVGIALLIPGLWFLVQPNGGAHVHLVTALFAGTGFGVITSWLARVASQARRNKRRRSAKRESAEGTFAEACGRRPALDRID